MHQAAMKQAMKRLRRLSLFSAVLCGVAVWGLHNSPKFFASAWAEATPTSSPSAHHGLIKPGDLLAVGVGGLTSPAAMDVKPVHVDREGRVALLYLTEPVKVAGLTTLDAEDAIGKAYTESGLVEHANAYIRRLQVGNDKTSAGPIANHDLLRIAIYDLDAPAAQTVHIVRVNENGMVSVPFVARQKLAGLSEAQAEAILAKAYGPKGANLIANPTVAVLRLEAAPANAGEVDLPDALSEPVPEVLKPFIQDGILLSGARPK